MADPFSAAGGILGGAAQVGGFLANLIGRKKRQKHLEKREDSAVQRQAADMEKAGLSKTLAAGGGAQSGQVVDADLGVPDLSQSMAAAADLMQQRQEISASKAQEKLTKVQEERQRAELRNKSLELDQQRLDYQRNWQQEQRENMIFAHNMKYAQAEGEPYGKGAGENWVKELGENIREIPNTFGSAIDLYNQIAPNLGEAARAEVKDALQGAWDKMTLWQTPREKAEVVRQKGEAMQADPRQRNPFGGP